MIAGDGHSDKSIPMFNDISYIQWLKDFKAHVIRYKEVDFVLKNPDKPKEPFQDPTVATPVFNRLYTKWESQVQMWETGNSALFSHIYFAVKPNNRAARVTAPDLVSSDGLAALEALKTEFETEDSLKGMLNDTLAEFQNRKILVGETISKYIAVMETYRLRLKNFDHEITDAQIIEKIVHGMTSNINQEYKDIKRTENYVPFNILVLLIEI